MCISVYIHMELLFALDGIFNDDCIKIGNECTFTYILYLYSYTCVFI
jgi:hypothetical protein